MDATRARYSGHSQKLVIAFDIGITSSGAAYAFLCPDEIPQIRSVTRCSFLNNPNPGLSKVSSTMYYDQNGNFRGVENGVDFLDSDAFLKMKWWMLMHSPTKMPPATGEMMSGTQLPRGKTIIDVLVDFMGYLFNSTRTIFEASEPNGELRWNSISNSIELVLAHPNEWGSSQQANLRTAAIKAGIVPDTSAGHASVHFVTAGEANLNFCASQSQAGRSLKPGDQALVIDAGSRTIDISSYKILNDRPLQVEELYEPKCLVQGEELVTVRATAVVKEKLQHSRFNTPEDLATFSQVFDGGLRKVFSMSGYHVNHYIKFGSPRDNDPSYGVKAGKLMFTGAEVSGFFEPSIRSTVDSIRDNFGERPPTNSTAFLIGSFAACPWFSDQLQIRLSGLGFQFCKPYADTDKAVAIGAVLYYVDHSVLGKVLEPTYGVVSDVLYDPFNPEHVQRAHETFINAVGERRVPGHFDVMLTRDTKDLGNKKIRRSFRLEDEGIPTQHVSHRIVKYAGTLTSPKWMDEEPDKFKTLCYVKADISKVPYTTSHATMGKTREYDIILFVGLTELKARVSCIDPRDGKEKRWDAVVLYDDSLEGV